MKWHHKSRGPLAPQNGATKAGGATAPGWQSLPQYIWRRLHSRPMCRLRLSRAGSDEEQGEAAVGQDDGARKSSVSEDDEGA